MNKLDFFIPQKRVLDFSDCQYLVEVHKEIQEKLELPEWYGQNLDSLWDALTGIMYVPADITIIYKPQSKKALELASEIDDIINVFIEAEQVYGEITLNINK